MIQSASVQVKPSLGIWKCDQLMRFPTISKISCMETAASATLATSVPQPTQEGILTRFLHTYFPSEAPEGSHKDGFNSLDVEEEDISELVKVAALVVGGSVLQQRPPAGSSSSSGPISNDFFETLPARSQQDRPLQAAQKLPGPLSKVAVH
eukprot:s6789_g1.t1